ncbi:MAG: ribonuclease HI [Rickettsiaceae bacterium H1]|nr:ribonuclease HI [Rickettsiaceae bacterium H1]
MDKVVKIYTDGACSGNPGKGGWGVVLISGSEKKEFFGGEKHTTNNRMELRAVIEGLKAVKVSCDILLYTDSMYVKNGITEWIFNWKKNGWKTANNKPVKNRELWQELDSQVEKRKLVKWNWVKGHSGDDNNELADSLARKGTEN